MSVSDDDREQIYQMNLVRVLRDERDRYREALEDVSAAIELLDPIERTRHEALVFRIARDALRPPSTAEAAAAVAASLPTNEEDERVVDELVRRKGGGK